MSYSKKELNEVINNLKNIAQKLKRRDPKAIQDFILTINYFESVAKGSLSKVKELDNTEREDLFKLVDVCLDGFEILKKIKYKFTPQMEREYRYMKKIRQ